MKKTKPIEFIRFSKSTPLSAFVGARSYAAENGGDDISFTIGPDVEITPEDNSEPQSLSGQRGIISTRDMKILNQNMVPAAMASGDGVFHPHHGVTRDEALAIHNKFDVALGMAAILKADIAQDQSKPSAIDLG